MYKVTAESDPELFEVHQILDMVRTESVSSWDLTTLKARLDKLKKIQEERGRGLFGIDITPEIANLEAVLEVRKGG